MGIPGDWIQIQAQVKMIDNPEFPHTCRIIRYRSDSPMQDEPLFGEAEEDAGTETVIYEGPCRGFNRDTVADNGDVNTSYRMLSLPVKQQQWTEETIPLEGDKIELRKFGHTEYGRVVDKRPGNLGTHIMWKYVRN